jgi:hypothetical protein
VRLWFAYCSQATPLEPVIFNNRNLETKKYLRDHAAGAWFMKSERKLPLKDAWVIWFILGVVMLNYPFLHIFNKNILLFGIPLTILYFFIGWPVSIFVIYLFSVYMGHDVFDGEDNSHDVNNQHRDSS